VLRNPTENAHQILVGKPLGKHPYGRPGTRWNIIKADLGEID
jgi:hypothetical protein